jgi:hypothetical protein
MAEAAARYNTSKDVSQNYTVCLSSVLNQECGAGVAGGLAPGAVHSLCGAVQRRSRTGGPSNGTEQSELLSHAAECIVSCCYCAERSAAQSVHWLSTAVLPTCLPCPAGLCTIATTATRTSQTMSASSAQIAPTLICVWSASQWALRPTRTATPTATELWTTLASPSSIPAGE